MATATASNPGAARNRFAERIVAGNLSLRRTRTEILQVNVGRICNLVCNHCHVNAGPARKEIMTRETIDRVIDWLARTDIPMVDITGGAPEMIPDFRYLVERVKALSPARHIIDRCNLTILMEPGHKGLAEFLAEREVEIIASLPCYTPGNVDEQRGEGVFDESIRALQLLNKLGYGIHPALPLHLVYNPNGAFLPGPQTELEAGYKRELKENFSIAFNRLLTITNMPIARFAAYLRHNQKYDQYVELLVNSFNPQTVDGLMCRNTLNVGWRGEVYDCDFNQMLDLQWTGARQLYLWDIDPAAVEGRAITTGDHCFGCTAGCGSSCSGALLA
ncbi:MAG TPA: arsenosugar biosynthesis radical SAM (seleno)protein ArsS [Verrucomicrobiae bacterium]|nr:arsenosugar biosynthesis radical SAM (seleno)protein ArsS [Verrucomicrobiae bacterium]